MPALERVSIGLLALLCAAVLALGALLAWRAHARAPGPDVAGAVLVMAPTAAPPPPESAAGV